MAFDAIFLSALRTELENRIIGTRIDKVQQPERHTVVLCLRDRDFSGRLLLSASPNTPRVHLTAQMMENPAQPPMFCMLLRKHLVGGKILKITQPPLERLLDFTLECTDEMGEKAEKHLIAELMGRSANLILTGADGRIIDCLRRVDIEEAEKRQVLPGLFYRLPVLQEKKDPARVTKQDCLRLLQAVNMPCRMDKWLLDTFGGLSPLTARELAYLCTGETDYDLFRLTDKEKSAEILFGAFSEIAAGEFTPRIYLENGRPKEFSYRPITQYGTYLEERTEESFGDLLDTFYAERDRADRMRQRTQTLQKTVQTLYQRVCRKLETQKKERSAAVDREHLRQCGDIVTANLHRITRGQTVLEAENFYDPEMKKIRIALLPTLSPQQNAARYYKDYARAKTAEKILTEQIALGEAEKEYLAGVLYAIGRAETEKDVSEIRAELTDGGYLRREQKKQMKTPPSRPMEFRSSEGFPIFVGRNNRQNDFLTLKAAAKGDLWLHAQKIHGSHVIVVCDGAEPGDATVTEAAMLAAWFSQAREGQNVPVDHTKVKFVKKPAGAKPGMVIYTQYATAYVTPDAALAEKLKKA